MTAYAFFFNRETFDAKRQQVRSGASVPIDHVGAKDTRPFTRFVNGDELFIVGIANQRIHLAGRMVVKDEPMEWAEAVRRTGRRDFIEKPLVCLADLNYLDTFDPSRTVPDDLARSLELFGSNDEPIEANKVPLGQFDANLFRACPRLSEASAAALRRFIGLVANDTESSHELEDGVEAAFGTDDDEYRLRAIKTRRGQAPFRQALLKAYGSRCVITGCRVEALLEAAHITPHAEQTDYAVSNGLLLRADIHTLFDLDLLSIDENYFVRVSPQLRYSEYWTYHGRRLERFPDRSVDQPNRDKLKAKATRLRTTE